MFRRRKERKFFKGIRFKKKEDKKKYKRDFIIWKMKLLHETNNNISIENILLSNFCLPIVIVNCEVDSDYFKFEIVDSFQRKGCITLNSKNIGRYYLTIVQGNEKRTFKCKIYDEKIYVQEETLVISNNRKIKYFYNDMNTKIVALEGKCKVEISLLTSILEKSTIERILRKVNIDSCTMKSIKELIEQLKKYWEILEVNTYEGEKIIYKIGIVNGIIKYVLHEGKELDIQNISVEYFLNKEA